MDLWLRIPYALNILILAPVCFAIFTGRGRAVVFQHAVDSSPGLMMLVGSLWLSILAASVVGLASPRLMAPLLAIQVFYKAVWLATYVAPAVRLGRMVPQGVAWCFAGIVVAWPAFLALAFS